MFKGWLKQQADSCWSYGCSQSKYWWLIFPFNGSYFMSSNPRERDLTKSDVHQTEVSKRYIYILYIYIICPITSHKHTLIIPLQLGIQSRKTGGEPPTSPGLGKSLNTSIVRNALRRGRKVESCWRLRPLGRHGDKYFPGTAPVSIHGTLW